MRQQAPGRQHAAAPRPADERKVRKADQHAQGERVGMKHQPPGRAARQQANPAPRPMARHHAQPKAERK
ncbi:MAG TPA: hypothetical protein VG148_11380, partial [Pyrinomonadaceae bacterium]|nr:hypothetical protein [Pyrinomonadaceae bacterium]